MITMIPGNYINEYYGKSTDTKPVDDYVPNGSMFYEMNTKKVYCFDGESKTWLEQ